MTDGIEARPELLERVRGELDGGSTALENLAGAESAAPNAGESTTTVAETLGLIMGASAGVVGGLHEVTQDVHATHDTYLNNDDTAADLFRDQPR